MISLANDFLLRPNNLLAQYFPQERHSGDFQSLLQGLKDKGIVVSEQGTSQMTLCLPDSTNI